MTQSAPDLDRARALDARLVAARKAQRGAEHRLAVLLAELADGGLFRLLGYASIEDYAIVALELTSRTARDLLRIGRRLPGLPVLDAALAAGEVDWTKAREIVRVATTATDAGWTERAKAQPARVIEREVAVARSGDPAATGAPEASRGPARRRVVFEMEAADAETLSLALALLRAQSDLAPSEVEDGTLLAAMARALIHEAEAEEGVAEASPGEHDPRGSAPADRPPTGERYRVVIGRCAACGGAEGPEAEVSDTIADEAACDAERIEMRPGPAQGHATRTIPPALRRRVLTRAGWRCEVPRCRNRLWLDVHHTRSWAEHKRHRAEELVVVCCAHHRAIHAGGLAVEVGPGGAVVVEHADGRRFVGVGRLIV